MEFNILFDNYKATNKSFLYYLHECDEFNQQKLLELCDAIIKASGNHNDKQKNAYYISFIYGQILKHIIYHFNPSDSSCIKNLPSNFGEQIERLENALAIFFNE